MKAFKKNQIATLINKCGALGEFSFQTVVVKSCGAKRMTLETEAGEMLGAHFFPGIGFDSNSVNWEWMVANHPTTPRHCIVSTGTFEKMSDEEATAFCLKLSADAIAHDIARMEEQVAKYVAQHGAGKGYERSMNESIAALKAAKPTAVAK